MLGICAYVLAVSSLGRASSRESFVEGHVVGRGHGVGRDAFSHGHPINMVFIHPVSCHTQCHRLRGFLVR